MAATEFEEELRRQRKANEEKAKAAEVLGTQQAADRKAVIDAKRAVIAALEKMVMERLDVVRRVYESDPSARVESSGPDPQHRVYRLLRGRQARLEFAFDHKGLTFSIDGYPEHGPGPNPVFGKSDDLGKATPAFIEDTVMKFIGGSNPGAKGDWA